MSVPRVSTWHNLAEAVERDVARHRLPAGTTAELGLAAITARCEELAVTRGLVREFADMLCPRHGEHLDAWTSQ